MSATSHQFQELKNTAKTKGHHVTKMSPQTVILPQSCPIITILMVEKKLFQGRYRIQ